MNVDPKDDHEIHELANLFPMMEGEEYEEFKKDIEKHGVRDKVTLFEDKILDGRNRHRAATELNINDSLGYDTYSGDDPVGFVLSKNMARRHLDVGQRAMIASELANLTWGSNQHKAKAKGKEESQICDSSTKPPAVSRASAAKALNVSPRSVDMANKVQREAKREGKPEVVEAVKRGDMSLNAAAKALKPETDNPVANSFAEITGASARKTERAKWVEQEAPELFEKVKTGAITLSTAEKIIKSQKEEKPLAKKQLDIRRTEEYRELETKHHKLTRQLEDSEVDALKLLSTIARLKGETAAVEPDNVAQQKVENRLDIQEENQLLKIKIKLRKAQVARLHKANQSFMSSYRELWGKIRLLESEVARLEAEKEKAPSEEGA
ncbi:hypothetical protein D3C78_270880 [compost metagenome]